jgi:hypothetical protein
MALKYFTNAFKANAFNGNSSDSIAINSNHVVSVYESIFTNSETNEVNSVTIIFGVTGNSWQVTDSYLDVVARLNERD